MKNTYQGCTPTSERNDSQNESPMRIVPSKSVHKNSVVAPVSVDGNVRLRLDCVTLEFRPRWVLNGPRYFGFGVLYVHLLYDTMALSFDQRSASYNACGTILSSRITALIS